MPNEYVFPTSTPPPTPTTISPALLKTHSITPDEYTRIEAALGRVPSLTELGIFSVMWSEHCSYKSSRVHLKRLPTKGTRLSGPGAVVQGPGENAGIIDVGEGWACAFKIESHNHPSYIEPYQGAATGVGGILRDIFTMGARPMAVMDSLRFGPLTPESDKKDDTTDYARNRQTMAGVVHGVGGYGNCFGVPNLGGETRFEQCYSGNPLLNAFALGLVRTDEIFYAKAEGVGNPVFYVGAKTGRDGIHGATMASEEFTEGSEQKRPNVQMGDPFLEKLLLEACLEVMQTGAVLGIQDMGAAGLTCSTCEMGARGSLGVTIELDKVPQRETGMSTYEIMLSESQERMLLVAAKGREEEVLAVFRKWGLDCAEVGLVTADDVMRVYHGGILEAEIPNKSLTDDAPVYHRPVGTWTAPVPKDPPAWVLEELKKPRDYTADLKKLLASANICDKRWIYEQYDSMVQTNTVQGPGGEAGVIRIKGTGKQDAPERGLAMALAGNGRWCYLDPKLGAMHAVAEAARKVACTGATPVAATNCLNFGNPEKPEIMAQLSQAIDGITEACNALGTPVTGGNVSLYNETKGEGIYPTPVIGIVGILDDVTKAVPSGFVSAGHKVIQIAAKWDVDSYPVEAFGSSDYAKTILQTIWGRPEWFDLREAAQLNKCLISLASEGLLRSACDLSDGGLAVALAKACLTNGVGVNADSSRTAISLFGEQACSVVISCSSEDESKVRSIVEGYDLHVWALGDTTDRDDFWLATGKKPAILTTVSELRTAYSTALESQLAEEVLA
ncbi:phosphoribosylformylglycinamidine synthase subunit PurL [Granulicella tundricola]|uniref:Phosphoribosylformylglycinamidine synthase subunit PurL n=1 Tax=Granulicella tundricola (strain ATCC BAA-1859 / DSM 23138 / MP5ACTX9) TaxID=1198114 RepID=E8WVU1_GRATM|nr:phosphoribosylformylglycinamidine synthase subunit PurL [Granulicella tundricola]ADW70700.1 phosphoribosylformylglycinamidine synthase II [Granulicella tundricola MP5ACTX9]